MLDMAEWKNRKSLGVFDGIIWPETPASRFNVNEKINCLCG